MGTFMTRMTAANTTRCAQNANCELIWYQPNPAKTNSDGVAANRYLGATPPPIGESTSKGVIAKNNNEAKKHSVVCHSRKGFIKGNRPSAQTCKPVKIKNPMTKWDNE